MLCRGQLTARRRRWPGGRPQPHAPDGRRAAAPARRGSWAGLEALAVPWASICHTLARRSAPCCCWPQMHACAPRSTNLPLHAVPGSQATLLAACAVALCASAVATSRGLRWGNWWQEQPVWNCAVDNYVCAREQLGERDPAAPADRTVRWVQQPLGAFISQPLIPTPSAALSAPQLRGRRPLLPGRHRHALVSERWEGRGMVGAARCAACTPIPLPCPPPSPMP